MQEFLLALRTYLYGIGWGVVAIQLTILAYRLFDRFTPLDFGREIREQNTAFAVVLGMFLFGISFGVLYLAAHL